MICVKFQKICRYLRVLVRDPWYLFLFKYHIKYIHKVDLILMMRVKIFFNKVMLES